MKRRSFLMGAVGTIMATAGAKSAPFLKTRGVVITQDDLTLRDWPERAARAGLTTIALHPFPNTVQTFIKTEAGQQFLSRCRALKLQVEYELHAMSDLLPRSLFAKEPSLFRMNERGNRVSDANLCVHSERALEIVAENALAICRDLKPTTHRYFLWGDDAQPWCRCPECQPFSDSDQSLILTNHLARTLRRVDPKAQVAYLAYANTLPPPTQIKPTYGVFLEYAPIHRRYDLPYAAQTEADAKEPLSLLDDNLKIFDARTAQVLEYWVDVSRFSKWSKPATRLPWRPDVMAADLQAYAARGVRHVTSFAVYIDADYVSRHGEPPLQEYGSLLRATQRK